MTLRKITIDNSACYVPQSELTKARGIKQNTIKNKSNLRKQNKRISQSNGKLLQNKAAGGFGFLN